MKNKKSSTVKLGLFVTVAIILFTSAVYYIGNKQNLFGSTFTISALFENINGLQPGNNVRYAGINVGYVDKITIENDTLIKIDLLIQEEVREFIKTDAIASISTDGLVGNMIVNIAPGSAGGAKVKDKDLIQSLTNVKTNDMMNTLGKTNENIALLTENLLELTNRMNNGSGSIPMLLNDAQVAEDLHFTIKNLRQTSHDLSVFGREIDKTWAQINAGQGIVGYLLNDTTLTNKIDRITQHIDTLVHYRTTPIIDNLEKSSKEITVASEKVQSILNEIDLNQGLAFTLLKDSTVSADLTKTMNNLNEGTELFNETMEALQHNFLVRGFFKKKAKKEKKRLEEEKKALVKQ